MKTERRRREKEKEDLLKTAGILTCYCCGCRSDSCCSFSWKWQVCIQNDKIDRRPIFLIICALVQKREQTKRDGRLDIRKYLIYWWFLSGPLHHSQPRSRRWRPGGLHTRRQNWVLLSGRCSRDRPPEPERAKLNCVKHTAEKKKIKTWQWSEK